MTLWLHRTKTGSYSQQSVNLDESPAPCLMAGGIGGGNCSQYWIEDDGQPMTATTDKPPYRVPTMAEIREIPWNGFNAVSTFSGGGGSSTGYRMAGFRVLWASEFVEAARKAYAANKAPYTVVDGRDIRQVQPEDILEATGLKPGELDLFDGSPPCASFSTAGKREAGWGKVKKYSDTAQRTDDLFFEFSRLVRGLQPKTFVAENVSGLVKGTAKGYFLQILADLKACGYRVKCKVLDAQWLGVPQTRQRTIFVGVREDLGMEPVFPKPLPYRYSVRDAIPWIVSLKRDSGGHEGVYSCDVNTSPCQTIRTASGGAQTRFEVEVQHGARPKEFSSAEKPSPAVVASRVADVRAGTERRKFTIAEVKRICSFPDDFILPGSYAQQWERLGRAVPPVMMMHIAVAVRDGILSRAK